MKNENRENPMTDMTEFNLDFNARKFFLKNDYHIKAMRLENAITQPENRAIVHKALTRECPATIEPKLAGRYMTVHQYYLAARQDDYDKAHAAYGEFLDAELNKAAQTN